MAERKDTHTSEQEQAPAKQLLWWKRLWGWTEFGRKSGWDWLQLLVVPLALAAIGLWFTAQQDARQQQIEEKRARSDRRIEKQRAQDAALQAYLDQMSQLMLEGGLRSSQAGSEVRTLARARTRTVLARLNSDRKGSVVQFLYEAALIDKEHPVVSLSQVGLRDADLSQLDLSGADLSGADLRRADLHDATLSDANLSQVELNHADLRNANLSVTNLSSAELKFANLSAAELNHADLGDATLSGADLSGALLRDTDLSESYLIETNLRDADLSDADLSDAVGVTDEQLEQQADTLERATMPNGSIHD